jgi:hypothetical protein
MPITVAPSNPTEPALRPFDVSPPALVESAGGGADDDELVDDDAIDLSFGRIGVRENYVRRTTVREN